MELAERNKNSVFSALSYNREAKASYRTMGFANRKRN
jgi:hypothetical protein